jgi:hypothetical protein
MALQFRSMRTVRGWTPEVIRAARNGNVVITRRGHRSLPSILLADVECEGYGCSRPGRWSSGLPR